MKYPEKKTTVVTNSQALILIATLPEIVNMRRIVTYLKLTVLLVWTAVVVFMMTAPADRLIKIVTWIGERL